MPAALNLSNEVVKMRAEVKRIKVFLIRKLSRQISALQKKKGNEASLEKNGRRAARLREEIRELKAVVPDSVTKAALQKDISFEKVCRDKEASLTDRATARIATHPEFSKKIQSLKAAIKAFKEERMNARKAEKQAKGSAESDSSQDTDEEDDDGSERSNNRDDEDGLKEDECDKKTDELIDSSSQETLNKHTNQCQEEERLDEEGSSEAVSISEEVIRMRKEVKRTRVAIISKLAEEVAFLKKKKGEEYEVKESQERAAVLLKEIQALRSLKPDQVTMTALQENMELEKILLDNQASPIDRAIAHIATHSRFINKLQKIKEEKIKAAEAEKKKTDKPDTVQSKNEDEELEEEDEEEVDDDDNDDDDDDDDSSDESEENCDKVGEKSNRVFNQIDKSGVVEPDTSAEPDTFEMPQSKTDVMAPNDQNFSSTASNVQRSEKSLTASHVQRSPKKSSTGSNVKKSPEKTSTSIVQNSPKKSSFAPNVQISPKKFSTTSNIQSSSKKSLTVSNTEFKNFGKADKEKTTLKPQKKQDVPQTERLDAEKDDEESDLSDDEEEEEKEYFDDSTEERFHKQSSQSEDSDDDDFFMGKVSKFKKRKSNQSKVVEKKRELPNADKEVTSKPRHDSLGKLESVFCSTLSKSNVSSQKAKYGSRNDGQRPPRFQNQRKGPEGRMKASQYKGQDLGSDKRTSSFTSERQTFKAAGQMQAGPSGAGRGKPKFENRQNQNSKGPPGKMSNQPQQSLHPSWEASRKRKEQQAQITAFQGKKIRFDDD